MENKKSRSMNISVALQLIVLSFVYAQDKLPSDVANTTVYSGGMIGCKWNESVDKFCMRLHIGFKYVIITVCTVICWQIMQSQHRQEKT